MVDYYFHTLPLNLRDTPLPQKPTLGIQWIMNLRPLTPPPGYISRWRASPEWIARRKERMGGIDEYNSMREESIRARDSALKKTAAVIANRHGPTRLHIESLQEGALRTTATIAEMKSSSSDSD